MIRFIHSLFTRFATRPIFHSFAALVVILLLWTIWYAGFARSNQHEFKLAPLQKGALMATVSASGTLNAVTSVTVGTQVSGQIKTLLVDYNSEVKQGQLIAQIDPENIAYQVRQAEANLDAVHATVATQEANISAQQAQVAQVQVSVLDAKRDFDRKQMLVDKAFISPSERDKAEATYNAAQAQLKAAQAQLAVSRAQANNARALVRQSEAQLAQARVNLERTAIRAPVDGVVIKRSVEPGQTVAASLQSPELFIIAKSLQDMQVETAIDESDVGKIKVGQEASFTVDAFAGRTFNGRVKQIRKAAQTVSNVVTYTVIISADNPELLLLPGMTANVRIVTDKRDEVLKLPNAALRFKPANLTESTSATGISGVAETKRTTGATNQGQNSTEGGVAGAQGNGRLRERIMAELKPDETQKQQLDSIFEEMRAKMMSLRDASAEERPKLAERNRAEMRSRIETILKPEQKSRYAELIAELGGRSTGRPQLGKVYVLDKDNQPKAVNVRLGLSDGSMTEIVSSDASLLAEKSEVIVGVATKDVAKPSPMGGGSAGNAGQRTTGGAPRPPF